MNDGTLAVTGAAAIILGLLLWLVKGPWDPNETVRSWLGNRAMVMVRTIIAGILGLAGIVFLIWGLVSML